MLGIKLIVPTWFWVLMVFHVAPVLAVQFRICIRIGSPVDLVPHNPDPYFAVILFRALDSLGEVRLWLLENMPLMCYSFQLVIEFTA